MIGDKIKLMRKTLFKILLIIGLVSGACAFANVDDFKNNVFKLDLYKTSSGVVNANIYTTLPYSVPISVIKKSETEYFIFMPEVKSALVQTTSLKAVEDVIGNIEVKTQPYSKTPPLDGYTKITITALKPIQITTSVEALKTPDLKTNSVNAFLERLDQAEAAKTSKAPIVKPQSEVVKQTPAPKPAAVKPTEKLASKPIVKTITQTQKVAQSKPMAPKAQIRQPEKINYQPKRMTKPAPMAKPVTKPVEKIAKAPLKAPEDPVVKQEPVKEPAANVEEQKPQVEETQTTPIEETSTEVKQDEPQATEKPADTKTSLDEYTEEEPYSTQSQSNMLKNILLIIGAILGLGGLGAAFVAYSKKLKQSIQPQPQIYQEPEPSEFRGYMENELAQNLDENEEFNTDFNYEVSQEEIVTNEALTEPEQEQEFDFSDEPIKTAPDDDFVIEEPQIAALNQEDVEDLYNENFEQIVEEPQTSDNDFIVETNWDDDFSIISEIEEPKKTVDELFSEDETTSLGTLATQVKQETQQPEIVEEFTQPQETPQIVEEQATFGLDVQSSFNIDAKKSIHLIQLDGKTSLIGTIDDNVFVLKTFDLLLNTPIQARLYESGAQSSVYMVKAGAFKGLIDVSTNAMGLSVEL